MREIKFRAWDKNTSRMLTVLQIMFGKPHHLVQVHNSTLPLEVQNTTDTVLMQFTGLKDKNGNEIYEGDIVQTEWAAKNGAKPLQVVFQPPNFVMKENPKNKRWYTFNLSHPQNQFEEVIGNIYENPELTTPNSLP